MATPNYGYEKRQRELAKKKKKEEKVREREYRKQTDGAAPSPADEQPPVNPDGAGAGNAPGTPT